MSTIFYGRCEGSALYFKNLFDLLTQLTPIYNGSEASIRIASFKIDKDGMQIYSSTSEKVWVSSQFKNQNFSEFKVFGEINIGANLELVKLFFKNAKKHDHVSFRILTDDFGSPVKLEITITKKDNMSINNIVNIHTIQSENLDFEGRLPETFVNLKSCEFTTMCRNIHNVNTVNVETRENCLYLHFDINDISKTTVHFENRNILCESNLLFNAVHFKNANKLASLDSTIKIYISQIHPIIFETKIGDFGIVRVWIKPN